MSHNVVGINLVDSFLELWPFFGGAGLLRSSTTRLLYPQLTIARHDVCPSSSKIGREGGTYRIKGLAGQRWQDEEEEEVELRHANLEGDGVRIGGFPWGLSGRKTGRQVVGMQTMKQTTVEGAGDRPLSLSLSRGWEEIDSICDARRGRKIVLHIMLYVECC
jgi:hypothetical protein